MAFSVSCEQCDRKFSVKILNDIKNFTNIPCSIGKENIYFYGKNAIKFLDKIYDNDKFKLKRKYERYLTWKDYITKNIRRINKWIRQFS